MQTLKSPGFQSLVNFYLSAWS